MSRFFRGNVALKPENALKRAEELIGVGQKQNALQTLHDTITNKRQQRNWTKALEEVMFKYMDLAVDMKQGRKCKDALINYRNTCQQVNVGSLEEVINYLTNAASERAEKAREEAQARLEDVADLEADASPEEMMLSYVSGEKTADRTDREVVTPWFKFLWETHRNVLDVLRNNSRLEALYAAAAQKAFAFCLQYKRTTEFRRLCDILRNHLSNLIRYRDQTNQNRTDLAIPATWELYVEMRFGQLRTACDLELWAEAFRSVEDIQGLLALMPKGTKGAKPSLMATYYARLTQIFTRSEARLYNAYAWYRLFVFSKSSNKSLTPEDVQALASNVVLSALSVLPYEQASAGRTEEARQIERERAVKMAGILGFSVDRRDGRALLSRSALLVDIERKGLLNLVSPEVRTIYSLLEGEFNPLTLCRAVAPALESLPALGEGLQLSPACPAGAGASALDLYKPHLQQVALIRTVRQLSEVYSVMRVSGLSELAPFVSFDQVETLVVDAVRHGYVQARFDHKNATVHFGGQEMHSDRVSGHLAALAKRLSRALTAIEGTGAQDAADQQRAALVRRALETAAEQNARALERKIIIEKRKEEAERLLMEKERVAEEKRLVQEALAREQEEIRKQQERARREAEMLQRELEEKEQEELKAFLAARGRKVGEGEKLDAEVITKEAREEHTRAQVELQRKLAKLGKQMDHLERARREEEAPLLAEAAKEQAVQYKQFWENERESAKAAAKTQWERDLEMKHHLQRITPDADAFAAQIQARRAEEFAALKAEKTRQEEERRKQRAIDRDIARKREYVRLCRMEIESKRRAEEEAARAEEEERKAREDAERQRKLDEIAEKQRQREAEIEAKARGDGGAAAPAAAASSASSAAAAPSAGTKGGYMPPHLRKSGGGGGGAPPPARSDDRDRGAPPSAGSGGEGRDTRPAGGAWRPSRGGGGREDGGREEPRGGDRERESGGGGGGYRPPAARQGGSRW